MEESTCDNPQQKEDDLFYFESDHLALRGNKDYSELLKTLFVLSAQRERAFKDFEKIQQLKTSALADPAAFLETIKNNEFSVPPLQNIAQIPFINWYAYDTNIPEGELKAIYSDKPIEINNSEDLEKTGKKGTYKQHWTPEEQKKLEELLVIYPPEPIELRRIKKIAAALGNRTVKQVSSRLQKYFLKLHKAGLHVPGRTPKSGNLQKKGKNKHNFWKPTTFFPEYNVSVYMDDTEVTPGPSNQVIPKPVSSTTPNYLLPMEYHQESNREVVEKSEVELQLELLKRIKAEKLRESERTEPYRHLTLKCDYCNEEPILGTRWHCSTCIQESIDFCTDCLIAQLYSDNRHPLTHKFVTLPHPDDPNFNISSDSDSDSTNGTSINNDVSDSDASAHSSLSSVKLTPIQTLRSSMPPPIEKIAKNGLRKNSDGATTEVNKLLSGQRHTDAKDSNNYSTQDIGYSYLHSKLSMND